MAGRATLLSLVMRFSFLVLCCLLMLSGSAPVPLRALPSAVSSPIVPAIFGTWQAGQVLAVNFKTGQMHIDHSPVDPTLNNGSLMPYGQRIEFTNGYDKLSKVAYWQVYWLLPLPPNACQYPFFRFRYTEINGVRKPDQTCVDMEFTMEIGQEGIEDFFR